MRISDLIIALLLCAAIFFAGYAVSAFPVKIVIVIIVGLIFSILTVINVEIGLLALIFVIPFTQQIAIAKFSGVPFDVGTDDILIVFIIISWLANLARKKESIFLKTPLNWPLFAFFTFAMFSFIGADARFREGSILLGFAHLLKFYEYVIIYFIVVSAVNSVEQIKRFMRMFFVVVGFIVVAQFVATIIWGGFSLATAPPSTYPFVKMMQAFQTNSILGAYYAFFLSILIAVILERTRLQNKIPLILFAIVISFALFNTFSRSAYLGLICAFAVLGFFKEKRLFLLTVVLLVLSPLYLQSGVLERVTLTIQAVRPTVVLDYSSAIRLVLWQRGLQVFLNHIVFGTGYWTTRWALAAEAHSQYLAILIETGIAGFSVFLWLIIRMFKNALTLVRKTEEGFLKALGAGYIAGFVAILVTCFFSETLEAFRVTGSLWFVTGLITSANRMLSKESREE